MSSKILVGVSIFTIILGIAYILLPDVEGLTSLMVGMCGMAVYYNNRQIEEQIKKHNRRDR